MKNELSEKLGYALEIIFPNEPSEEFIQWFQNIESKSFRENLCYTRNEILDRWMKENSLIFFLVKTQDPIAVLLGYNLSVESLNFFYLDTLAVIPEGKGIGSTIIRTLIKWASALSYAGIKLDTERDSERGKHLLVFYEKLGFKFIEEDNTGDIILEYRF
ncbi:MAG: GNAT family N-acetyltransferase [Candidatus Hermodarchaeota archaeon]